MKMLLFFGSLDDFILLPPLFFFLWDSKKYLSQKNVVEKLNANVMHGKVRKVRPDDSQRAMIQFEVRWKALFPLASVSGCPTFSKT